MWVWIIGGVVFIAVWFVGLMRAVDELMPGPALERWFKAEDDRRARLGITFEEDNRRKVAETEKRLGMTLEEHIRRELAAERERSGK